ncbi:GAF domain-containing protein [Alteromonas sp. 345S023]|uniref:GAF domain-containing protein n=1 Tax=Alteromonas profundi TaxID=2696062 RepID=A0A7X5LM80_9ALTE|nr:GAF domain-containing protein [Alteromonas profundi]NDV91504.1 GAF domain-containing protein [Alteromonas profundi]
MNKDDESKTSSSTLPLKTLLANCEKEALHLSGKIQGFGAALFIENESLVVTAASENVASYIGLSVSTLIGLKVHELDWLPLGVLYNLGVNPGSRAHAFNESVYGQQLNFRSHRSDSGILIEIEPTTAKVTQRQYLQLKTAILPNIGSDWKEQDYWEQLITTLNELLPCERVLLYRFNEQWSGEVVAEKVIDGLQPYLKLKFPASDIPAIARQMYHQNPSRYIADSGAEPVNFLTVSGAPLDLTYSDLRSVSPIHGEYMQNMGVRTSFSIPIMQQGKLWGIVSCHHSSVTHIDSHVRYQAESLVKYFSMIFSTFQSKSRLFLLTSLDQEVSRLSHLMVNKSSDNMNMLVASVAKAFAAQSCALFLNDTWYFTADSGLDKSVLGDIDKCCRWNASDVILHEQDIRNIEGLASVQCDATRGIMLIRLNFEFDSARFYLFRVPEKQVTHWAGDPDKTKQKVNEKGVLTPRASFERWSEVDGEKGIPWSKKDILLAKKLRAALIRLLT